MHQGNSLPLLRHGRIGFTVVGVSGLQSGEPSPQDSKLVEISRALIFVIGLILSR